LAITIIAELTGSRWRRKHLFPNGHTLNLWKSRHISAELTGLSPVVSGSGGSVVSLASMPGSGGSLLLLAGVAGSDMSVVFVADFAFPDLDTTGFLCEGIIVLDVESARGLAEEEAELALSDSRFECGRAANDDETVESAP
jgi:hypothetical protein